MPINITAFGLISEFISGTISVDKVNDTDSLRKHLAAQFPSLKDINYAIAVDKKIISVNTLIEENATIALLPPFSGG